MATQLQTPNPPVNMLSSSVSQKETSFTVYCHDNAFKHVTASDSVGNPLFRVEGATFGTSWSWRRKFFDSSGSSSSDRHLFDFRHESFDIKNSWVVESSRDRRKLCSFVHKARIATKRSVVDVTVRTEVGEDVLVVMRPAGGGYGAEMTIVAICETPFATIRKVERNNARFRQNRNGTVWEVRVASGVDMSLVRLF